MIKFRPLVNTTTNSRQRILLRQGVLSFKAWSLCGRRPPSSCLFWLNMAMIQSDHLAALDSPDLLLLEVGVKSGLGVLLKNTAKHTHKHINVTGNY